MSIIVQELTHDMSLYELKIDMSLVDSYWTHVDNLPYDSYGLILDQDFAVSLSE